MLTLESAKKYLRVDGDADDDQILEFITAADAYVRNAVTDYDTKLTNDTGGGFAALSNMVQKVIVSEMYDDRSLAAKGSTADFSFTVRSMIGQLQYTPTTETEATT